MHAELCKGTLLVTGLTAVHHWCQVSSRLTSGAEALKTSGDMRAMGLRQSISGALQRVSGLRSPSGRPEPGEPCLITWLTKWLPLRALRNSFLCC